MSANRLAIVNCNIVLEDRVIYDGTLLIEDGIIAKYGRANEIEVSDAYSVIDAEGGYVGPGFVDIHVHGANGKSINFDTEEVADFFLRHGTTTILASPWYKLDFDTIMSAIKNVKSVMHKTKNVKGIYMEGPYTNPKYGSHAVENPWRAGILEEQYKALVDEAGELAKVWTVAPELDRIYEFVSYAKRVNPNTVIAVGHSEATPEEIRALGKYRPTLETHSMNATGRVNSHAGILGTGPDEYAFSSPDVYCELISDSYGVHVHTELQQMLYRLKGAERIVLITDCSAYNNPAPQEFAHVKDVNFSPYGEVAGSRLTMDMACRNIMSHTRASIADAFLMASTNPAKVINMYDSIGSVDIGKRADLVVVDDKFNIKRVLVGAETV